MRTYCEVVVIDFLPAVKALVAKTLLEKHGMTQVEVAKKMKTSQPAISYYKRELRGTKTKFLQKNEKIMEFVDDVAAKVFGGSIRSIDMPKLCKLLHEEKLVDEDPENCNFCPP